MKMIKLKYILILSLFLTGCTRMDNNQPTKSVENLKLPDQELWQSVITITRDAKKVAEVWAGYIVYYKEDDLVILRDSIHVDFYDSQGKHNSVLTADSGVVYNETSNLVARGRVVVVSDSGIVLETEELKWDNEKQKIISEVPVKFTTQTDTLIGESFISDPDLKNYEIRQARGYSKRKIPLKK